MRRLARFKQTARRCGLWIATGSMVGCAPKATYEPEDWWETPPRSYHFQVDADIVTALRDASLHGLPQTPPDQTLHWDGALSIAPARRFRDHSVGYLVHLDEINATAVPGPALPSTLQGRSIELRAFEDGEVLAFDLLEHITGPGRDGDILLPLWNSLWVDLPHIAKGASEKRLVNLPFFVEGRGGALLSQQVLWTYLGQDTSPSGTRGHHFKYRCTLNGKGRDTSQTWHAEPRMDGRCDGAVWVRTSDLALERHEFHWEMNTVVSFESLTDERDKLVPDPYRDVRPLLGQVSQHQMYDGVLVLNEEPE